MPKTKLGYEGERIHQGLFNTCYKKAAERGYEVVGRGDKGLILHISHSENWATITEVDNLEYGHRKIWKLVRYDHEPSLSDPEYD